MAANDQRCSSRKEDWERFRWAWQALGFTLRYQGSVMGRLIWANLLAIGHTGKNILVEEWRRIRGKCPEGDEHAQEQ